MTIVERASLGGGLGLQGSYVISSQEVRVMSLMSKKEKLFFFIDVGKIAGGATRFHCVMENLLTYPTQLPCTGFELNRPRLP